MFARTRFEAARPLRGPGCVARLSGFLLLIGGLSCSDGSPVDNLPVDSESTPIASFAQRTNFDAYRPYTFFDLGVVDFDGDGDLDVFTSNHSDLGEVWENLGDWKFESRFGELGLHQDSRHPGLESLTTRAEVEPDSLRIYWQRRRLVLETRALEQPQDYRLRLHTYGEVVVNVNEGFAVESQPREGDDVFGRTTLEIDVPRDGRLKISPYETALPITVQFAMPDAERRVFVGRSDTLLADSTVEFALRDRHGMAWSHVDGNEEVDVLITRGALRGQSALSPLPLQDELLLAGPSGFVDARAEYGLEKPESRARRPHFFDFDRDGDLDLLLAGLDSPLKLWRRDETRFVPDSQHEELGEIRSAVIGILDSPGLPPRFLVPEEKGLVLFGLRDGEYVAVENYDVDASRRVVLSDLDSDGTLDAVGVGAETLTVLRGEKEGFVVHESGALGLPKVVTDVQVVDVDNDGDVDLFLPPHGLYFQEAGFRFAPRAGSLPAIDADTAETLSSWADLDGDGDRDLLLAVHRMARPKGWRLQAFENRSPAQHWLQVDLWGGPGNRNAVGSVVEVVSEVGKQTRRVGEAEGSHFSQGHYRVYFGLGASQAPVDLRVIWPDGTVQNLAGVAPDRRVQVSRVEASDPEASGRKSESEGARR